MCLLVYESFLLFTFLIIYFYNLTIVDERNVINV